MVLRRGFLHVLFAFGMGAAIIGCDHVSPTVGDAEGMPPVVSDLRLRPDSVLLSGLPEEQIQDSTAEFDVSVQADVVDPDGAVERVVFTIEPASDPRSTATGRLQPLTDTIYGRAFGFEVPAVRDELYTVRVFAVDSDSLASNQALGQIQFVSD